MAILFVLMFALFVAPGYASEPVQTSPLGMTNSEQYMYVIMLFFYLLIPVGLSRLFRQKWKNILIAYVVWIIILTLWGISLGINQAGWAVLISLFTTFFMVPLLSFIINLILRLKVAISNE